MERPSDPQHIAELTNRIERLDYSTGTLLYLSGANLIMNVLTILIGFLIGLS
jgi:hypothetical protein